MSDSSDSGPDAGAASGTDSAAGTDTADAPDTATSGAAAPAAAAEGEPVVVCFDMDGVLVDSEDYWHPAQREEIFPAVLDGAHPDLDEVTGMNYREMYAYLDGEYATAVSESEFVAVYDEAAETIYGEEVSLLAGAREFVADLRAGGVPVALVSSSPPTWIGTVTERFDLSFDLVRSADEFDGPGKPDPGIYEAAVAGLGGVAERAVVVEDSEHGVRAGAAAGAYTIAYRDDHNADTDLSAADEIADSPEDLFEAVRQATRTLRDSRSGTSGSSG
ncbi:HAD family hydrolase [Candidatus Halobonum tyrrellensis]|uniref:HAD family hydrolase n=1 Tax=Candidatus Halobonum tyrrellensis TaxID=1431545 RepID=UPI002283CCC8|nr:HAD family phosphatase [Candidatus Halobonum tyrrellensis]